MRQVTRKGLMTVAAATGVIAAASGTAHATGSGAQGGAAGSPGVLSGNSVQAPVHAPVNLCGNTVTVIGGLNASVGNACANGGSGKDSGGHGGGHQGGGHGGAGADGHATDSPGVGSGNHVEAPVHVPVNVCGNTVSVVGVANPATGNDCGQEGGGRPTDPPGGETPPEEPEEPGQPEEPGEPEEPEEPGNPGEPEEPGNPGEPGAPEEPGTPPGQGGETPDGPSVSRPAPEAQLAATGSELPLGLALPMGAGVLLTGAMLYRRARASV